MGQRGIGPGRTRPTHVQAKLDSKKQRAEEIRRQQRAGHPELASARRWRRLMFLSLCFAVGNLVAGLENPNWFSLFGAAGSLLLATVAGKIARYRTAQADGRVAMLALIQERMGPPSETLADLQAETEVTPEQARDEASWQAIIYGEHSLYSTTQRAIDQIDAELNEMVEQQHRAEHLKNKLLAKEAERQLHAEQLEQKRVTEHAKRLAEERRLAAKRQEHANRVRKWKAMPPEMQAQGCGECLSFTHREEDCMAGPLVAERKEIDGEWITTWVTTEPVKKVEYSPGGIVEGYDWSRGGLA